MALNRKALGTKLLELEKGASEEIKEATLDRFALVRNNETDEDMICFTVREIPEKYFWASTSLYHFLEDNIENAELDNVTLSYSFPDDTVIITHMGKVPLKSDKQKVANVWEIEID